MYFVKRVTSEPASPIKVFIAQPESGDAGLGAGGSFGFYPVGSPDGESGFMLSEYAAKAIMSDPGIAPHFTVDPELPSDRATSAQDAKRVRAKGKDLDV